jgi:hypothetical protein
LLDLPGAAADVALPAVNLTRAVTRTAKVFARAWGLGWRFIAWVHAPNVLIFPRHHSSSNTPARFPFGVWVES